MTEKRIVLTNKKRVLFQLLALCILRLHYLTLFTCRWYGTQARVATLHRARAVAQHAVARGVSGIG